MKKLLICLLALLCLILPALGEEHLVVGGVTFSADGTTLIEYPVDKTDAHYAVPDGVVTIGDGAFFQNEHLESITLPDSVKVIGTAAFQYCANLTELYLPTGVTELGRGAFVGTKLTVLRIPTKVSDLPEELLYGMPCLTDVYFSFSVKTVDGKMPEEGAHFSLVSDDPAVVLHAPPCSEAEKIIRASGHAYVIEAWQAPTCTLDTAQECLAALPEDYEDMALCIDEYGRPMFTYGADAAFALITDGTCMYLTAFYRYDGAWEWYFSAGMPLFGVEEGLVPMNMYLVDDTLTLFMGWGEKAVSVTAVFDYNGWGGWYVTESTVYVPDQGGWSPESRTVYETPPMLHLFSLTETEQEPVVIAGNTLVRYPESRTDTHYTVPAGVEIIGEYAFSDNLYLTRVTLPESVRVIEHSAFTYCHNLRIVDMPSTLESLGENAFDCTYVQQLTIPSGLTALPAHAFAAADLQGTVVIPEGVTDIGSECFVFNAGITDLYLPASLQTIEGETFQQGAEFWYIWGFNSINEGETHMTIHAPAGTEAARFARWSGESYVIEDAREGTDLPAVTAWVQCMLDAELPGAIVSVNEYGFPCVTYSADTVMAYAVRPKATRYGADEQFLCCFDRNGTDLTLRWVNADAGLPIPLELTLTGDRVYLMYCLGEESAVALTFSGENFHLTQVSACYWVTDTGGPPPFWATGLTMPITDGAPLSEFITLNYASREQVVQGAMFTEDNVLLCMYDMIPAAGLHYIYEDGAEGICRFMIGNTTYELNEQEMTLCVYGEEDPVNLISPAPGADDFRSGIINGRWMVDSNTVYCTFRSFLGWPIRISIDHDMQMVTVKAE